MTCRFLKLFCLPALLFLGLAVADAPRAEAGIFVRRVAPVRRVATRAVFPPYPVARRAVVAPVYRRPVYGPVYGPVYHRPYMYGPGISVGIGW